MEKMTSDDYPSSINEFYELLVRDRAVFEREILDMDETQIIAFYEHILGLMKKLEESTDSLEQDIDNIWYIKSYLEVLEVIDNYLSINKNQISLTEEDERLIEETVRIIEERKHPSPLKRLIKYIRG